MRREGRLTGYIWNKKIREKVKVQGKPTNASKISGRCGRPKCQACHESPVSKAKTKTKGRNKRALWLPIDDEWALHSRSGKHIPAGRIKAVVSLAIDSDYDDYDAHDACLNVADVMGDYVNNDSYVDDDNDADKTHDGANDAEMHAHDDVKDAGMLMHAAVDNASVAMPLPAVAHDYAGHAIVMLSLHNDDADYGGHTMMVHAADDEDDHANYQLILQSSMTGFVNVEWRGLRTEEDDEEVSDIESETDWYTVTPSDAIDDWFLC